MSDAGARGLRDDRSGDAISAWASARGDRVVERHIVPDQTVDIVRTLLAWCDGDRADVVLTTGGTGLSPRDVTPEATRKVIQRETPGLAEAMRAESLKKTPHAMLSRAVASICGHTLIVNLPGSPKGAVENLQTVLPVLSHAVQLLTDDPKSEASH